MTEEHPGKKVLADLREGLDWVTPLSLPTFWATRCDPEHLRAMSEYVSALQAENERLRVAMELVKGASVHLDKHGMKPGWGSVKDMLHSAIARAALHPTEEAAAK